MSAVVPAEWAPHAAMWLGFPSHAELWREDLAPAQEEAAVLARALAEAGGEQVKLMVCGEAALKAAARLVGDNAGVDIVSARFGDIWLRDTGPIFTAARAAAGFEFNGWGGKYLLDGDEAVAGAVAARSGAALTRHGFILEGGALDHDGAGTVLTTRQCLLNPNRNPGWNAARAEQALAEALGARKVIWLGEGLAGDHTDGHVDNLARFVAPGVVVCPAAFDREDPNAEVYDDAAARLAAAIDADGVRLKVVRVPSPGLTVDDDGGPVAASHMNFLIANRAVLVPLYNEATGALAVEALQMLFTDRAVIGLKSNALLTGGGSFHCISQQVPA